MLDVFRDVFWDMSRQNKGYYSLAADRGHPLIRLLRQGVYRTNGEFADSRYWIDTIFRQGLGVHPVLDCVFEALARAEARLSLRFIPQNSHEERLTGSFVSELEAAFFLLKPSFAALSKDYYGKELDVDFQYFDLSKGGSIEKFTGGDLAVVFHMDLPDLPPVTRYAAFQVKKMHSSATLDKKQYRLLLENYGEGAMYIFYDMLFGRLYPPLVVDASQLEGQSKNNQSTDSFQVSRAEAARGLTFALWVVMQLARGSAGVAVDGVKAAVERLEKYDSRKSNISRLAVVSIGAPIKVRVGESGVSFE